MTTHVHVLVSSKDRFIKLKMQIFAEIGPTLSAAAATATLSEDVTETKDVAEDVTEILKDRGIESSRTSRVTAHTGVSETVVQRSLLAIGKNCVRLGNLLELIFRFRVIRIAIGVIRHRELAISALDFDVGGHPRDPEHFVTIAFGMCGQKLLRIPMSSP
jgi:hypothetical protein